jgi:hypothetical protein
MRLFEDGAGELGMKGIESPCLLVFVATTTTVRDETACLIGTYTERSIGRSP